MSRIYTYPPLNPVNEPKSKELIRSIALSAATSLTSPTPSKPSTPSWVASIPILTELQLNKEAASQALKSLAANYEFTQIR